MRVSGSLAAAVIWLGTIVAVSTMGISDWNSAGAVMVQRCHHLLPQIPRLRNLSPHERIRAQRCHMELRPEHITIAVTVYSRRDYVLAAVRSALEQTVPVNVIVVEDCGPDAGLRDFITGEFGGRIQYFRNQKNRGLV